MLFVLELFGLWLVLVVVLVVVGMSVGPAYKQHVERQDLYEARAALGEMKDRARAAYQRASGDPREAVRASARRPLR